MKMIFMVLVIGSILVGCTSESRRAYYWTKHGPNTKQEFEKDKYECAKENERAVSGASVDRYGGRSSSRVEVNIDLTMQCMRSRGWYETDIPVVK